jgi:hypothetical protein
VVLDRDGPDGLLEGLSDNYLRVWFAGNPALRGGMARVHVEQVTGRGLLGSVQAAEARPCHSAQTSSETAFVPVEAVGVA